MPMFKYGDARLHYEVFGTGYPVLALAPGGMRSRMERWNSPSFPDPRDWLARDYRVITLDQRNAGQSRAPIGPHDDWASYLQDHLALLDHLGVDRFHILGACIGVSFALRLCRDVPDRVSAAVLQNPIGLVPTNRMVVDKLFRDWEQDLPDRSDNDRAELPGFQHRMFGNDFIFSVSRDDVHSCRVPLILLPGRDDIHPGSISEEIAALAPNVEVLPIWKGYERFDQTISTIRRFLGRYRPTNEL